MRLLRFAQAAVLLALTAALLISPALLAAPDVSVAGAAGALRRGVSGAILLVADQPLGAVLRTIGERYPGHALEARRIERDGRAVYRIKWLGDDGKVREITADARTGEILTVR
ncbi:MAG TPA: PepSY domain-containing protein [Geminicoccaceae bacterium]|nr:PepSY domain-containing protein [Geminicoccaceae bacterium]